MYKINIFLYPKAAQINQKYHLNLQCCTKIFDTLSFVTITCQLRLDTKLEI